MLASPPLEMKAATSPEVGKPIPRHNLLQRQSRATIIWALGSLILIQAGLRVGIDSWWPELRDPTFEIKGRRLARIIAQSPRPPVTVVMVGSSVTRNAFKAKFLEQLLNRELDQNTAVVNMGMLGAGPLTELVWVKRLIARGTRLHFVCVEVNPLMYNNPGLPQDASRLPAHLLSEGDLEIVQRYSPESNLRENWSRYWWFPAYAHRLTILNYLAESLLPGQDRVPTWGDSMDDRFWAALSPHSPEQLRESLVSVKNTFTPQLKNFTAGQPSFQALEELLALLKKEGIPTAVVFAPQGPLVRSLYPKEPLNEFVQQVAHLSRQNDCVFIDAFDWLDEEMFVDSIHPNFVGADVFSTRLAREVLLPALKKTDSPERVRHDRCTTE